MRGRTIAKIANSQPALIFEGQTSKMKLNIDASRTPVVTPSTWTDVSGNGSNMNGAGSPVPGIPMVGKLPSVKFPIGGYYDRAGVFAALSEYTAFVVVRIDSTSGTANIGGVMDESISTNEHGCRVAGTTNCDPHVYSNSGTVGTKTWKMGVPFCVAWTKNSGGTARMFFNGVFVGTNGMNGFSGTLRIMQCAYGFDARKSAGFFNHAFVVSQTMSDAMISDMSRLLLRKWQIPQGMMHL